MGIALPSGALCWGRGGRGSRQLGLCQVWEQEEIHGKLAARFLRPPPPRGSKGRCSPPVRPPPPGLHLGALYLGLRGPCWACVVVLGRWGGGVCQVPGLSLSASWPGPPGSPWRRPPIQPSSPQPPLSVRPGPAVGPPEAASRRTLTVTRVNTPKHSPERPQPLLTRHFPGGWAARLRGAGVLGGTGARLRAGGAWKHRATSPL